MKIPSFGQLSIRVAAIGPVLTASSQEEIVIRLGYEPGLGKPLLVGIVPAADLGTEAALRSARYAPWQGVSAALFTVNFGVYGTSDGRLAVFIVQGQPAAFGLLIDGALPPPPAESHQFVPVDEAAFQWWTAQLKGPPPSPVTHDMIEALVRAVHIAESRALKLPDNVRPRLDILTDPRQRKTGTQGTAPDRTIRFAVTCCLYPPGLFDRAPAGQSAIAAPSNGSLLRMGALPATSLDFILMLGDQVYVDATAGTFDPALTDDRYLAPYERWLTRPEVKAASAGVPVHALPDDHEFIDNWSPVDFGAESVDSEGKPPFEPTSVYMERIKTLGLVSVRIFQGPSPPRQRHNAPAVAATLYRKVGIDDIPDLVFLCDTRTERECRNVRNIETAQIVGQAQNAALQQWLSSCAGAGPRFLASPSMVLPRRQAVCGGTLARALRSDSWDGYPHSLQTLLARICELRLNNLILLSGDEHLASISRIRILDRGAGRSPVETVIHAIHAPALYAPYPICQCQTQRFQHHAVWLRARPNSLLAG